MFIWFKLSESGETLAKTHTVFKYIDTQSEKLKLEQNNFHKNIKEVSTMSRNIAKTFIANLIKSSWIFSSLLNTL